MSPPRGSIGTGWHCVLRHREKEQSFGNGGGNVLCLDLNFSICCSNMGMCVYVFIVQLHLIRLKACLGKKSFLVDNEGGTLSGKCNRN